MTAENTSNSLIFQIDQLLDEASKLAKTEQDSGRFFDILLQRTVLAVQAQAAAIWMLGTESHPVTIAAHQLSKLDHHARKTQQAIDQTIGECIEKGQAKKLIATGKSSALSVFCCPYDSGAGSLDSAIAIYFADQVDPESASVCASFAEAIAEIAADFGSRQQSQIQLPSANFRAEASATLSDWNKFKSFSDALHENLDVRSTAISLVNHGRAFYECDRVLLAQRSRRSFRIIAASGAATVNRKSETVAAAESLIAKAFYRNSKPIVLQGTNKGPPRLAQALQRYQAVSGHEFLVLCPLLDKRGSVTFVQIIESAQENDVAKILKRVTTAEPQTKSALRNAVQYQSIPMRGLLSWFGGSQLGGSLARMFLPLVFVSLFGLAIGALSIVQTDLIVAADGNIVAETEKNIFAAKDGVVSKLHVEHNDQVQTDQLLIEMSSNKIDLELSRIVGDIKTEAKRLEAIEAVKSSVGRGSREGQRELGRLSSQEIESKQRMKNLNLELTQSQLEQDKLQLRSPIDGTIVTRDPKVKLLERPVHRGDVLLRLVAHEGKWLAKIRVPDSRIAHLMRSNQAQKSGEGPNADWQSGLPVSLFVATFPEEKFEGTIRSVSNTTDIDTVTGEAFIVVTVEIKNHEDITFQPGSSVVAQFNCGQTSAGYAWFNEFIDSVRYRFF